MPDRGRHTDPSGNGRDEVSRFVLSRRGFLKGAAGAGALATVGALAGCRKGKDGSAGLMVSSSNLVTTDDFEEAWFDDVLSCDVDVELDAGTMAWGIDDQYALLMRTGEGAHPLNTLGLFNLQTGNDSSLLDHDDLGLKFPCMEFKGWSETPDGAPVTIGALREAHGSGNVTLYALWEAVPQEDEPLKGDVNGDGALNNRDVVVLFRYLSGEEYEGFDVSAADVNGDGTVNNKDITTLFRIVSE